jgi:UDP-N-acetylmuramate dehydrogenase
VDDTARERIRTIGGEAVSYDMPMSHYTTLKVGGNAEVVFKAKNREALREMVNYLRGEGISYLVVGRGSNLLVGDEGLQGVVILLNEGLTSIEAHTAGKTYVKAEAGVALDILLNFCTERGLAGLEFLAGIPGTFGGAVAMNAGAWGKEIKDILTEITILTGEGTVESKARGDLSFRYRELDLPQGSIILDGSLSLSPDRPASIKKRVISYRDDRKKRQPTDMKSAGSVFKNPEGDYAGRLIEAAGLKGRRAGGAMISPKHANFIVNTGGASASDIITLMDLAVDTVEEMFHVALIPEIRRVGRS